MRLFCFANDFNQRLSNMCVQIAQNDLNGFGFRITNGKRKVEFGIVTCDLNMTSAVLRDCTRNSNGELDF